MSDTKQLRSKSGNAKWRLGALLPLGAALSGMALAAPPAEQAADTDREVVLDDVKVKANRDKPVNRFKADTSTTGAITKSGVWS